jgi:HEAT repeat protein
VALFRRADSEKVEHERRLRELSQQVRHADLAERMRAVEILAQIGDAGAKKVLRTALRDADQQVCEGAQQALEAIERAEYAMRILEAPAEPPEERQKAARVLAELGSPQAVQALASAYRNPFTELEVRQALTAAIGEVHNPEAEPVLFSLLAESDPHLRQVVVRALGNLGSDRVGSMLRQVLDSDESLYVRREAAVQLGGFSGNAVQQALKSASRGDVSPDVRKAAQLSLSQVSADRPAVHEEVINENGAPSRGRDYVAMVLSRLPDALDEETRLRLLDELGSSMTPTHQKGMQSLIHIARDETETTAVRRKTLELLARLSTDMNYPETGRQETITILKTSLDDPEYTIRETAAVLLGDLGVTDAIDGLIFLLRDGDPEVRQAAIASLSCMGEAAARALLECLNEENSQVREAASESLGRVGEKGGLSPQSLITIQERLMPLLEDPKDGVRQASGQALLETGWKPRNDSEQITLAAALTDWDTLRNLVVKRGGRRKKKKRGSGTEREGIDREARREAIHRLTALLRDADSEIRRQSASILGEMGDRESVPSLLNTLTDHEPDVRREAAKALGMIGDPAAVDPLREAQEDGFAEVRQAVEEALGKLTRSR